MRNTLQYPITPEEINRFLDELSTEFSFEKTKRVGDMRPLYIRYIKQHMSDLKELVSNG